MDTKSTSKVTLSTFKSLLKTAEEHQLAMVEFNGIKIVRGGPPKPDEKPSKPRKDDDAFREPESVEELDAVLHKRLSPLMEQ